MMSSVSGIYKVWVGDEKMNKTEFKQSFSRRLAEKFAMSVTDASPNELYQTLGSLMT